MVSQHQEKLKRIFRTVFISLTIVLPINRAANYNGYKVYQLFPDTSEKIALLKGLNGVTGYDFWHGARDNASKLMVSPEEQPSFEELMASVKIKIEVVLIDGGIHAREWAAPMSVLFILRRIIDDEDIIKHLTFYIIPIVNPDGYEYSHQVDRYWRKTMSKQPFSKCLGVDANRNFDSHWNEFGSESEPCSGIYSGPRAFSEPESIALRDLIKAVKPVMYLTFHTYGGLILYPWGFTKDLPQNWQELDSLGRKAAAEIKRSFKTDYTVGSSTNVLYRASGGSDDWSMEKVGVPLVYCIELEDYGENFVLPPEKLGVVVRHAETIFRVFVKHVQDKYAV